MTAVKRPNVKIVAVAAAAQVVNITQHCKAISATNSGKRIEIDLGATHPRAP